jgi:GH18 family chitinase
VATGAEPEHGPRSREKGHEWTDDEAATALQGMWRRRQARIAIRKLISKNYEKVWDEEHQAFYYFNVKTGQSEWARPRLLGAADIGETPRDESVAVATGAEPEHGPRSREKGHEWTDDEAATALQGMWRRRQARIAIRKMVSKDYEKVWDEDYSAFFYYNKKTGASEWVKPRLLGNTDLDVVDG